VKNSKHLLQVHDGFMVYRVPPSYSIWNAKVMSCPIYKELGQMLCHFLNEYLQRTFMQGTKLDGAAFLYSVRRIFLYLLE
jgi:hypothetical protein